MARRSAAHKHVHQKKEKKLFDYVVYFFSIATPLFELPQLITIYQHHDASRVSWPTWTFFFLDSIVYIIYAWKQKMVPLLITSSLFALIESAIVVGIILYT